MITRDDVKVGDYLVNNDPRKAGQKVRVEAIMARGPDFYVVYQGPTRRSFLRLDRIYKPSERARLNGWTIAGTTL